jgi:hypothetical protein
MQRWTRIFRVCAVVGVALEWAFLFTLPVPAWDEDPLSYEIVNWVGQAGWQLTLNVAVFLTLFYAGKLVITLGAQPGASAIASYTLLVLAGLPCIWLFVAKDWYHPDLRVQSDFNPACWLGTPMRVLFVPTLSFAWNQRVEWSRTKLWLTAQTAGELLILIPVWWTVWLLVAFVLGFYVL